MCNSLITHSSSERCGSGTRDRERQCQPEGGRCEGEGLEQQPCQVRGGRNGRMEVTLAYVRG